MATQLQTWLGQPDGGRELARWFADVLRDGKTTELDAFLAEELRAHADPISTLCFAIPAHAVAIVGWTDFYADYLRIERRTSSGRPITAVGMDLSSHCEPDGDMWGLETSFYDDGAFPFGAADVASVNAEAAKGSTAWQGNFRDLTHSLSVTGLGSLYARLDRAPRRTASADSAPVSVSAAAVELGWLFLTLRFHQAIRAAIAEQGLPKPMIVIGGTHDVPPYVAAAYWCERTAHDLGEAAARVAQADEAQKANMRRQADEEVEQWRMRRTAIVKNELRRDKRAEWIDYCTARDASLRSLYDLGGGPPVHLLSDHDFEMLMYEVRCHWAHRIGDPLPPPPRAEPARSGFLGLFGRRSAQG